MANGKYLFSRKMKIGITKECKLKKVKNKGMQPLGMAEATGRHWRECEFGIYIGES